LTSLTPKTPHQARAITTTNTQSPVTPVKLGVTLATIPLLRTPLVVNAAHVTITPQGTHRTTLLEAGTALAMKLPQAMTPLEASTVIVTNRPMLTKTQHQAGAAIQSSVKTTPMLETPLKADAVHVTTPVLKIPPNVGAADAMKAPAMKNLLKVGAALVTTTTPATKTPVKASAALVMTIGLLKTLRKAKANGGATTVTSSLTQKTPIEAKAAPVMNNLRRKTPRKVSVALMTAHVIPKTPTETDVARAMTIP
jgi:hypothetical protein